MTHNITKQRLRLCDNTHLNHSPSGCVFQLLSYLWILVRKNKIQRVTDTAPSPDLSVRFATGQVELQTSDDVPVYYTNQSRTSYRLQQSGIIVCLFCWRVWAFHSFPVMSKCVCLRMGWLWCQLKVAKLLKIEFWLLLPGTGFFKTIWVEFMMSLG